MDGEDDEFTSPRKSPASSRAVSLSLVDIKSSAASEAEIDELTRLWQWEKQRADRANDHIEYLEAECRLHACSCMKKRPRSSLALLSPKRQKRGVEPMPLADPSDRMILSEKTAIPLPHDTHAHISRQAQPAKSKKIERKGERRATIFLPDEGTFRTVTMEEAEAMEKTNNKAQGTMDDVLQSTTQARGDVDDVDRPMQDAPAPVEERMPRQYSRTPSVEPPSFAVLGPERASLMSMVDVAAADASVIPAPPGAFPTEAAKKVTVANKKTRNSGHGLAQSHPPVWRAPLRAQDPNIEMVPVQDSSENSFKHSFDSRPHTATSFYKMATTTTTVPLREETEEPTMAKKLMALQRTPSRGRVADDDGPTWDVNNPALTPTMTREQALAKIRERRGRAKSGQAAAVTPRKVIGGARGDRRDLSAPAGRKGRIGS